MEETKMSLWNKETKEGETADNHNEELRKIIEESVDNSVKEAFKKYGRKGFVKQGIGKLVVILVLVVAVAGGIKWWKSSHDVEVGQLSDHDLTLENKGYFGYKAADFEDVILEKGKKEQLLIVEERDASVNTTMVDAGFLNLGVFSKEQIITIHGTGQYTVDLRKVTAEDISLNEETYELTIKIPQATLRNTTVNEEETEIGDTKKGWLAFGDISMTAEQTKAFCVEAREKLDTELLKEECLEEANRFAKLSAYEMYQPIVNGISPAYKVLIEIEE